MQSFINNDILTQTSVEIPYGGNIFATSSIPAQEYVLEPDALHAAVLAVGGVRESGGDETAAVNRRDLFNNAIGDLDINISFVLIARERRASPAFQAAKAGNDYLGPVSYMADAATGSSCRPSRSRRP